MICSECGREILDAAVICPGCGCATSNYSQKLYEHSSNAMTLKEFISKANTIKTLGILAAVFCWMILGIVFAIIVRIKSANIIIPEMYSPTVKEFEDFQDALRKVALGRKLAKVPFIVIAVYCILILILIVGWMFILSQ